MAVHASRHAGMPATSTPFRAARSTSLSEVDTRVDLFM
jgi:hypothetical protein